MDIKDRMKIENAYCCGIDDIVNILLMIEKYQQTNSPNHYLSKFNCIRFAAYILRLYDISITTIINIKNSDVNITNSSIMIDNESVFFDKRLFRFIIQGYQYNKNNSFDMLIHPATRKRFVSEREFSNRIGAFATYCKKCFSNLQYKNLTTISLTSLRDSMRFEQLYLLDSKDNFSHNFDNLKPLLKEFYFWANNNTASSTRVLLKYELYLKWYEVFYGGS